MKDGFCSDERSSKGLSSSRSEIRENTATLTHPVEMDGYERDDHQRQQDNIKHIEADRRKRAMATDRPGVIIVVDYEKRIGCKYFIVPCPYGARLSAKGSSSRGIGSFHFLFLPLPRSLPSLPG